MLQDCRSFFLFFSVVILSLFLVACTVTKRRYRAGFQIEWKTHSKSTEESPRLFFDTTQPSSLNEQSTFVQSWTEEPSIPTNYTLNQSISGKFDSIVVIVGADSSVSVVSNQLALKFQEQQIIPQRLLLQPSNGESNKLGAILLGILLSIIGVIIPPLIFTLVADFLNTSVMKLIFLWLLWASGIIGCLLLFSGFWPIAFAILIWNLMYFIVATIFTVMT